ncbi:MAG: hypothetical protein JSW23_03060 [Planctomycetota bacterium]|nr:MAG: hypothetical protein JSW23_03060 [Planctomycetota bacterium]
MEHIKDIELIEYVGGTLAAGRHRQLQKHITVCEGCAERCQQMLATWDTLDNWDVDTAAHSIAGRIETLAAADKLAKRRFRTDYLPRARLLILAFRVAASIIIGIGFGYMLARWIVPQQPPATAASTDAPKYVDALGLEWSNGFVWSVLDEPQPEKDKEQAQ